MILGLKGKVKGMYSDLQKIRAGTLKVLESPKGSVVLGKKDLSMVEYLGAMYPDGKDKDGVFDIQHVYNELGINPNVMTVEQLIDLDPDTRWLVPEIFRDAIRKGIRSTPNYSRLVAASETIPQPQHNMPYWDLSDAEPDPLQQGETIGKGSVTYGSKMVSVSKQGLGVSITYEALQFSSLNMVSIFLEDVGIKLGQKLDKALVDILVNGDQANGSESAAVIGVNNPVTGLLYRDLLYAWIRGSRLGRMYSTMVASEAMANTIMNLTEFKDKQAGTPQQSVVLNATIPSQSQVFLTGQLDDTQVVLMDVARALVQLTATPLTVEGEKIISKQIQDTYATITTGFANIFRDARVVIDASLDVASNDFPAYMTPNF